MHNKEICLALGYNVEASVSPKMLKVYQTKRFHDPGDYSVEVSLKVARL
jgi:hypothetical protein